MTHTDWYWTSRDGLKFYGQAWTPETVRAAICVIHGHGEHSGRYAHVARAFNEKGYALFGFDLRGHGKSEGLRGHTPSYEHILNDTADFLSQIREKHPTLPLILYGHSMGGNIAANFALNRPEGLKALLITGPWLRLAFEPPASKLALGKMMDSLSPAFIQPSGLETAGLSRDPEVVRGYIYDPLVHDKISARMFIAMYTQGIWALEHASELTLPTLLMHGGADRLTSCPASREFAERAGSIVTYREWDGWYHEIHNEPDQQQLFTVMTDWFDQQLAK